MYIAASDKSFNMNKVIFLFLLLGFNLSAQGVKISPQPGTPDPSAILETQDSTRGVLMPRVNLQNLTDAVTIANPATSLMVFNTGATLAPAGFYYNAGTPQAPQWALVLPNPANTALNMNGFAIENLATPVNPADAVTKDYVDNQIINVSGSGGGACICPTMISNESAQTMNLLAAITYCQNLTEGGFSDWKFPDLTELLVAFRNPSVPVNTPSSSNYLWTFSAPGGRADQYPYYIRFSDFNQATTGSPGSLYYARCVR
jgi:hypothetical protein